MLPPSIPIFPLPNVVLFPNVFLPLHIFEQRFREMVADAVAGDRIIGMVLLRPGWEEDYQGRPPVYPVGCAGLITNFEQLDDGRYNIILRGMQKFRIADEDDRRSYRQARVEGIAEPIDDTVREAIRRDRGRLEAVVAKGLRQAGTEGQVPTSMPDEDLVNALAQYLDLEPVEKQALLERDGPLARCESLIELLEMKMLLASHAGQPYEVQ
jgi:Lon protease-like protein